MYIEITTICNQRCPHCAWSRTKNGKHMPLDMLKDVVEKLREKFPNEKITLGGGEPLLHPNIEEIVDFCSYKNVSIITNGTTKNVLNIHKKIYGTDIPKKNGKIDFFHKFPIEFKLSFDRFRKTLRGEVYKAFLIFGGFHMVTPGGEWAFTPYRLGRANGLPNEETMSANDHCFCPDLFITVDGFVKQCGCEDAPILGFYSDLLKLNVRSNGCYKLINNRKNINKNDIEGISTDEYNKLTMDKK